MYLLEVGVELAEDEWENEVGIAVHHVYELETNENDEHYDALLSILNRTKYHSKISNLLPFKQEISNQDFIYNGWIYISLDDDYRWINFLGDNRIVISSENENTKVYHMSNSKVLDEFAQYMKKYGIYSKKA